MTSSPQAQLFDLMNDIAIIAMAQFIHIYAPETMDNKEEMIQWCESIASTSYVLASAMMDASTTLHKVIVENLENEEPNAT